MSNLVPATNSILLSFDKNRSKHLKKTLLFAKKADSFIEDDDHVRVIFSKSHDSLGRLYYLLRALYVSHSFRTVELGIDGHLLTLREIHDVWNTLSCFISTRRVKHTRNHCDIVHDPTAGTFTILDEDDGRVNEGKLVPCKRAYFEMAKLKISKESFLDVSRKLYCDLCPIFEPSLFRKVLIDEFRNVIETRNKIE